ncbi:MAG: hypothetical protein KF734_18320 [Saprospiraceae bacterium]|nr:hypothetical protein [Saprospiraceae bacterium]
MKHIFFLTLSVLAFSLCQTAPATKKRSLSCYVRYLEPENQLRAEATMREGDAELQPTQLADGLLYQGKEMDLMTTQGIIYRWEGPSKFPAKHVFAWKDDKGQPQQFEMSFSPILQFGFDSTTLSRKQPAKLRWEGTPLEKGESMVLLWENSTLNKTVPMEVINLSSEAAIEFPSVKIAELEPGTWTYYLVRKKLVKANVNGVAASGIIEHYTKNDTIQVK